MVSTDTPNHIRQLLSSIPLEQFTKDLKAGSPRNRSSAHLGKYSETIKEPISTAPSSSNQASQPRGSDAGTNTPKCDRIINNNKVRSSIFIPHEAQQDLLDIIASKKLFPQLSTPLQTPLSLHLNTSLPSHSITLSDPSDSPPSDQNPMNKNSILLEVPPANPFSCVERSSLVVEDQGRDRQWVGRVEDETTTFDWYSFVIWICTVCAIEEINVICCFYRMYHRRHRPTTPAAFFRHSERALEKT